MNFPKTAASLLLLLASLAAHALDTGRIPQNEIAVYVQELDSGKVIIDHRSDVPVNPASTMKLVTAFAAFKTFGSNYRWATEFKSNGTVNDGTLDGNLYWAGSGDPVFNQENLLAVQRQLREQGIRNITGHLMLDHSLWGEVGSPDDFEADSGSPFMTPPNPTMLSAGMVMVRAERNAADSTD
ncbi:TPA: D-alanyl-D-alanine carboxypeptidase, partial [Neisseria meningitidis]